MRLRLSWISLIFFVSIKCVGQWVIIDTVPSGVFHSFHFINADTGLVFNNYSTMRKTTDGGLSWTTCSTPYWWTHILDMEFYSNTTGYAAAYSHLGPDGMILKTIDGGDSWDSTLVFRPYGGFQDIEVVGEDEFFTGHNAGLIHSQDGGLTMDTLLFPSPTLYEYPVKLEFFSPDTGYALTEGVLQSVGSIYRLYQTYDKGQSWQVIYSDTLPFSEVLDDFLLTRKGVGLIVGEKGRVMQTSDGGMNWQAIVLPDTGIYMTSLKVFNDTVYAGGYKWVWPNVESFLFNSLDWGVTWQVELKMGIKSGSTVDMSFPAPNVGYILTQGLLYGRRNFVSVESLQKPHPELYPNPARDRVFIELTIRDEVQVQLFNIQGQRVMEFSSAVPSFSLDVSELKPGLYILSLSGDSQSFIRRLVKE